MGRGHALCAYSETFIKNDRITITAAETATAVKVAAVKVAAAVAIAASRLTSHRRRHRCNAAASPSATAAAAAAAISSSSAAAAAAATVHSVFPTPGNQHSSTPTLVSVAPSGLRGPRNRTTLPMTAERGMMGASLTPDHPENGSTKAHAIHLQSGETKNWVHRHHNWCRATRRPHLE